eukprot:TRINITY_DN14044_c0_g1_i6.p1 TRINITY_DN14044_c0_g1~~TRINITY_DN14044_c0_g1_i6.p1  ORF type:complete len:397 (-),score=63.44 TRINITY_DN14044_c0_g1_i6:128-1318(-)
MRYRSDYGCCDVPSDLGDVVAVAAGGWHTCASKKDGQLVCFGRNAFGVCDVPLDLLQVAAGGANPSASREDGPLVRLGYSGDGLCDDIPSDLGQAFAVAAAAEAHSCARRKDGELLLVGVGCDDDIGQCTVPQVLGDSAAIAEGPRLSSRASSSSSSRRPDDDVQPEQIREHVIELVHHWEAAAARDPEMAALQVQVESDENFARLVESPQRQVGSAVLEEAEVRDGLVFLQFSRCTKELRDALGRGLPLKRCRDELTNNGFNFLLPCRNMIFVHPTQYQDARRATLPEGVKLNCFYIIVARSLEYLVAESLDAIHGRGAWARTRETLPSSGCSDVATCDDSIGDLRSHATSVPCVLLRTFLVYGAQPVRAAGSVAQSTTEMNGGGMNPRRLLPDL